MKLLPFLLLSCAPAAAQEMRVVLRVQHELTYRKHIDKPRHMVPDSVGHLLVFKEREVRFNDRKQWQDEVYPVASIAKGRHMTYVYDCGVRTYTLDIKKQEVLMYDQRTNRYTLYYGEVAPYEVKPKEKAQ